MRRATGITLVVLCGGLAAGPLVWQRHGELPRFDDSRAVLGSWVIAGVPQASAGHQTLRPDRFAPETAR